MPQVLRRLQELAERWLPALTRYRRLESLPIELNRRRVYIAPSGFGIGFTVLLLVMLVGALNYANNAALLLTCLLGATSAASMLLTFRDLNGLRLVSVRAAETVAGQAARLSLTFEAPSPRSALRIDLGASRWTFAIGVSGAVQMQIDLPTTRRGWQPLPRLRVWSTWPLGMFRAWSWLYPDQSVLVWPRAEVAGPPPRMPADDTRWPRLRQGEDVAALRDYRRGDPQRHIAWKASARHELLLAKDFEQPEPRPVWSLDWRQLSALDPEARIARLARWLGEAHAQGRRYSLWLPSGFIDTDAGAAHYARCLNALAVLP